MIFQSKITARSVWPYTGWPWLVLQSKAPPRGGLSDRLIYPSQLMHSLHQAALPPHLPILLLEPHLWCGCLCRS